MSLIIRERGGKIERDGTGKGGMIGSLTERIYWEWSVFEICIYVAMYREDALAYKLTPQIKKKSHFPPCP